MKRDEKENREMKDMWFHENLWVREFEYFTVRLRLFSRLRFVKMRTDFGLDALCSFGVPSNVWAHAVLYTYFWQESEQLIASKRTFAVDNDNSDDNKYSSHVLITKWRNNRIPLSNIFFFNFFFFLFFAFQSVEYVRICFQTK